MPRVPYRKKIRKELGIINRCLARRHKFESNFFSNQTLCMYMSDVGTTKSLEKESTKPEIENTN